MKTAILVAVLMMMTAVCRADVWDDDLARLNSLLPETNLASTVDTTSWYVGGYGIYTLTGHIDTPSPGAGILVGLKTGRFLSWEASLTKFSDKTDGVGASMSLDYLSSAITVYLKPEVDFKGLKPYIGGGLNVDVIDVGYITAKEFLGSDDIGIKSFLASGGELKGGEKIDVDSGVGCHIVIGLSYFFNSQLELFTFYRYNYFETEVDIQTDIQAMRDGEIVLEKNYHYRFDQVFDSGWCGAGLKYNF